MSIKESNCNRLQPSNKNFLHNITIQDFEEHSLAKSIKLHHIIIFILSLSLLISTITILFITKNETPLIPVTEMTLSGVDNKQTDSATTSNNKLLSVVHQHEQQAPGNLSNRNVTQSDSLIISRMEWLAKPATNQQILNTPVQYVIIMHTATYNCFNMTSCILLVRSIQSYHTDSRGWSDIGYNFLVGGDGNAYEGRGWKYIGAHTYGYNSRSIGIALMGTFTDKLPSKAQMEKVKRLIQEGVNLGYISSEYKLLGARQLVATQSPGSKLFEDIQSWPHWSSTP